MIDDPIDQSIGQIDRTLESSQWTFFSATQLYTLEIQIAVNTKEVAAYDFKFPLF